MRGVLLAVALFFATGLLQPAVFTDAVSRTGGYLFEMLTVMPLVFLFMVLIEVWVPRQTIVAALGERSGFRGLLAALAVGSLSAGPIYAAFPLAAMLRDKGASVFNVTLILGAWAVIKVPMLANEARFLGGAFMGTRWILTVPSIILLSLVVARLMPSWETSDDREDGPLAVDAGACVGCGRCASRFADAFEMDGAVARVRDEQAARRQGGEAITLCPVGAISRA